MRIGVFHNKPYYLRCGHDVLLAYDQPEKRRDATVAAIEAHEGIEFVDGPAPASVQAVAK